MTLAAAPAEPELMVGHAPKLGKKHHHEQNEGYGSFFCTTWIKDGKSFRMINFAIMRGHLIIILTCVFTVYDYAKFTQLKNPEKILKKPRKKPGKTQKKYLPKLIQECQLFPHSHAAGAPQVNAV